MDEKKNARGGKREGAGRPNGKKNSQRKSPEELATQHSVYTTKKEWAIFQKKRRIKNPKKTYQPRLIQRTLTEPLTILIYNIFYNQLLLTIFFFFNRVSFCYIFAIFVFTFLN